MKIVIAILISLLVLPTSGAQFPAPPSIMEKGYFTVDPVGVKLHGTFRIERGRVWVDQSYSNGRMNTIDIVLANLYGLALTPPLPWGKWSLWVRQNGEQRILLFNSREDAEAVAKYLSEMSGVPLDKPKSESEAVPTPSSQYVPSSQPPPPPSTVTAATGFSCPPSTAIACSDFKELVSHHDPEIVGYMQKKDEFVLGCFSTEGEHKFAILDANLPSNRLLKNSEIV